MQAQVIRRCWGVLVMALGLWPQALLAQVQPEVGYGMPRDISRHGHRIDWLLDITNAMCAVLFVIMVLWMAVAMLKHGRSHQAEYDHGSSLKAAVWACGVSALIFAIVDGNIFYHAVVDLNEVFWNYEVPRQRNALRVEVNARQWAWEFRYAGDDDTFNTADDIVTFNEMHIPSHRPVVVQMGAVDVIHSFYLPNLRVKQDAIPGTINQLWFEAVDTGSFDIACAQHCGTHHYKMKGVIRIHNTEDFAAWQKEAQVNARLGYDPEDKRAQWGWAWREIG